VEGRALVAQDATEFLRKRCHLGIFKQAQQIETFSCHIREGSPPLGFGKAKALEASAT
jgi:hypothetical protein